MKRRLVEDIKRQQKLMNIEEQSFFDVANTSHPIFLSDSEIALPIPLEPPITIARVMSIMKIVG